MTEQMNVPKLRFGEFEGDWKIASLGQLLTVGNGKDYKNLGKGDIPVFGTGGYMLSVDKSLHDGETVFIGRKGSIDKPFYYDGAFWTVDTLFYTKDFKNITPKFTYNLFQRINWRLYNEATGVPSLSKSTIQKIKVDIPTLPEQQKIASFLSKVDEKIGLLTEKKDKLTEYKKGVMQQLFNGKFHQVDESEDASPTFIPPTLRFKADDGSEFPDWEEKKFGDCFDFYTTNSLSRDKLSYETGTVINIHYGDIHTKFRSVFKPKQENVPRIADISDTRKIKLQSYCQEGDLVFADASEDYADIGKCIEIRDLKDLKLVAGLHTHLARPKEQFALGYQAYLQKSWKMRYQIMRIAQGTKVLGISTKQLATVSVPIPSHAEQEKIASFLASLDNKIEMTEVELGKAKEWKKGLLQQMFV